MKENNINYNRSDDIGTIIYVAINEKFVGYIVISDKIKKDSKKTISNLKNIGIKKSIMLTGDKKEIGEAVAKELCIDEVYTELLPDEKVAKVEELIEQKSNKGKLVFVGDGINDAPVLSMSDIGIAMGGLGSDAAIEAADIVIMTDEPSKIVNAINLSLTPKIPAILDAESTTKLLPSTIAIIPTTVKAIALGSFIISFSSSFSTLFLAIVTK